MGLDLANYEELAREATKAFWGNRAAAEEAQEASGRSDQGGRSGVTAGKNMDGFIDLIVAVVKANGLGDEAIFFKRGMLELPGYYRASKQWDVVVRNGKRLVAAIELKSQVGPSFGNNVNNRAEEAIGTAHDFWVARREDVFGDTQPFIGWLMMVEGAPASRKPVGVKEPHFAAQAEFADASYLDRYEILCRRLVQEGLYTNAALLASERDAARAGTFSILSDVTSQKGFVAQLAAHVAAEVAT